MGAEQVGAQHPLPSWLRFHPSPYGSVPEGHFPWNYENLMGTYLYLKEWGPPCREAWGRGGCCPHRRGGPAGLVAKSEGSLGSEWWT